MKKAYLATFSITTRVVVDVEENELKQRGIPDSLYDKIIDEARDKILSNADSYVSYDNADIVREDLECPFNPNETDF